MQIMRFAFDFICTKNCLYVVAATFFSSSSFPLLVPGGCDSVLWWFDYFFTAYMPQFIALIQRKYANKHPTLDFTVDCWHQERGRVRKFGWWKRETETENERVWKRVKEWRKGRKWGKCEEKEKEIKSGAEQNGNGTFSKFALFSWPNKPNGFFGGENLLWIQWAINTPRPRHKWLLIRICFWCLLNVICIRLSHLYSRSGQTLPMGTKKAALMDILNFFWWQAEFFFCLLRLRNLTEICHNPMSQL